jgi:hypothetical protein
MHFPLVGLQGEQQPSYQDQTAAFCTLYPDHATPARKGAGVVLPQWAEILIAFAQAGWDYCDHLTRSSTVGFEFGLDFRPGRWKTVTLYFLPTTSSGPRLLTEPRRTHQPYERYCFERATARGQSALRSFRATADWAVFALTESVTSKADCLIQNIVTTYAEHPCLRHKRVFTVARKWGFRHLTTPVPTYTGLSKRRTFSDPLGKDYLTWLSDNKPYHACDLHRRGDTDAGHDLVSRPQHRRG